MVATATKALQEQLLTKDVPAAAAALGRRVRVAVLKGRQNYLCRKSLQGVDQLGGLFRTAEDAANFERLRDWIETTETGDRAELDFEPSETLWAELSVGAERCAGRRCPLVGSCYAEKARERAGEAELVIANHALYFADLALRTRSDGAAVLPEHDAVVFDEAHRLEEAAATWFGGRISLARLRQLERDVERFCREQSRTPPARPLAEVDRAGERLIGAFDPGSGRRRLTGADQAKLEEHGLVLAAALGALAAALMGSGEDGDALARRTLVAAEDVESCLALDDPDRVSWAERGVVAWAPVDVSGLLRESLWESDTTAVLVSATLDPRFVRRRLGLDDARELTLPSPFDFRDQALVYVPTRLPDRVPTGTTTASRTRSSRCAGSPRDAPLFSPRPTAPWTSWSRAVRRGSTSPCSVRATLLGSACSSASETMSTRSSSPPRRSGRAWTFRGSRSPCS